MMRNRSLAVFAALALAGCGEATTEAVPTKPIVLKPEAAPVAAAQPAPSADELLTDRVKSALRDAREVEGQGVGVAASGGVVTLYGTASAPEASRKLAQFVAGIEGVASVVNKLVVMAGS